MAAIYEGVRLKLGPVVSPSYLLHTAVGTEHAHKFHIAVHIMQVGKKHSTANLVHDMSSIVTVNLVHLNAMTVDNG